MFFLCIRQKLTTNYLEAGGFLAAITRHPLLPQNIELHICIGKETVFPWKDKGKVHQSQG